MGPFVFAGWEVAGKHAQCYTVPGVPMSCEPQVPLSRLKRSEAALLVVQRLNRAARAQLSRHRRWGRFAVAAGLGLLLLGPTPLAVAPVPKPCEAPEPITADVSRDGGTSTALPESFPPEWMRAPCPQAPNIRTIRRACFVVTGEKPPCTVGLEERGECFIPMTGGKRPGTSLGH